MAEQLVEQQQGLAKNQQVKLTSDLEQAQHESQQAEHESQQARDELKLRLTAHAAELVAARQQHEGAVADLQLKNDTAVQVSCQLNIMDHLCGFACCHLATEE